MKDQFLCEATEKCIGPMQAYIKDFTASFKNDGLLWCGKEGTIQEKLFQKTWSKICVGKNLADGLLLGIN
jgi:hypothetical protein